MAEVAISDSIDASKLSEGDEEMHSAGRGEVHHHHHHRHRHPHPHHHQGHHQDHHHHQEQHQQGLASKRLWAIFLFKLRGHIPPIQGVPKKMVHSDFFTPRTL